MRRIIPFLMILALTIFAHPAAAQKAFNNEDLASDGVRLEEQVKKDGAAMSGRPLDPAMTIWSGSVKEASSAASIWGSATGIRSRAP